MLSLSVLILSDDGDYVSYSGSPYTIEFLDASQITAKGDGLNVVPCHRQAHFMVYARGGSLHDLSVRITGSQHLNDGNYRYHLSRLRDSVV